MSKDKDNKVVSKEEAKNIEQDEKATPTEPAMEEETKRTVCADRSKYVKGRTADGKVTMNNGDQVAMALAGISLDNTYKLAASILPFTEVELKSGRAGVAKTDDKPAIKAFKGYGHLNVGMQRMSLGNKIRGAVNVDEKAKEPTGVLAKLQKAVAPLHAEAKKAAEALAKANAAKEAEVKAKEEAEAKKAAAAAA